MNSDRWRQIDELFQACLEVDGQRRAALLDNASRSDQALREAVEALLASDSGEWSFIEKPALEVGASLLAEEYRQLESGHRVGHYEIVELIGRGGMGEVYLARDQILNRPTALKFLPADYTQDKDRLRRFQREAQAASALNHPNILTIHQLGDVDGQHFIATELVEGETLRARLSRGLLTPAEAVEVAIQVSSALAAAHKAGIVHRDIKPENIMLRPDGYVKVLDFGLAKLTEQHERTAKPGVVDRLDVSSGLFLGTVKYMSPEQARGLPVDARSDIFSLGVVLYEVVTGNAPFKGRDANDLIKSILEDVPSPLTEYPPDLPEDLQRVLTKALAKDKSQRYQSAADLVLDLKTLQQQVEFRTAFLPSIFLGQNTPHIRPQAPAQTANGHVVTKDLRSETTSNIDYVVDQIRRHKTGTALGLIGLILLVGVAYPLKKLFDNRATPFESAQLTRLRSGEVRGNAAISPDGKLIAYLLRTSGQTALWIRQLSTGNEVQIIPPIDPGTNSLVFSPDGRYLYYGSLPKRGLYRIPASGGTAEKLGDDLPGLISFSPDGSHLAFIHQDQAQGLGALVIANADGTEQKTVATRRTPDNFSSAAPSWSPDGKLIACVGANASDGYQRVFEIDIETGTQKPLTSQKWDAPISEVAWLSDSNDLLLIAGDSTYSRSIWRLSYPSGDLQRITNDTNSYIGLSLTADSKTLVSTQWEFKSEIWIAAEGDASSTKRITSGREDAVSGLAWTPDDRIVYTSRASGTTDIWIMNADSTNQKQLTKDSHNNQWPSVTPDGRYIIFYSNRTGADHVWRMDIDGGNPRQLTFGAAERNAKSSPDSKWVVYNAWESGKATVWKVPIEGGSPAQITDIPCFFPAVSPDGNLIACNAGKTSPSQRLIIPFAGGKPTKALDVPSGGFGYPVWTPDGKALIYRDTRDGVTNIWSQPIDGTPSRRLTDFRPDQKAATYEMGVYAWSPDGKQLAFTHFEARANVVLIRDLK